MNALLGKLSQNDHKQELIYVTDDESLTAVYNNSGHIVTSALLISDSCLQLGVKKKVEKLPPCRKTCFVLNAITTAASRRYLDQLLRYLMEEKCTLLYVDTVKVSNILCNTYF